MHFRQYRILVNRHVSSEAWRPPAHVSGASYATVAVTMAHYKAANLKREQFRRYLEKSGVLDMLTKVLVALYEEPEKPTSALEFLKHHLGAATLENPEIELLHLELTEMKEKYEDTVEENKKLRAKVNLRKKLKLKNNLVSNDYLTKSLLQARDVCSSVVEHLSGMCRSPGFHLQHDKTRVNN